MTEQETIKAIGAAIKQARQECIMTQAEAAKWMGIRQCTMSKIEAGKIIPNAVQLYVMATVFNVTVDSLLGK